MDNVMDNVPVSRVGVLRYLVDIGVISKQQLGCAIAPMRGIAGAACVTTDYGDELYEQRDALIIAHRAKVKLGVIK